MKEHTEQNRNSRVYIYTYIEKSDSFPAGRSNHQRPITAPAHASIWHRQRRRQRRRLSTVINAKGWHLSCNMINSCIKGE